MGFKENLQTDIIKNGGKEAHAALSKGIATLVPTKHRGKAMKVLDRMQSYIQPIKDTVEGVSEAVGGIGMAVETGNPAAAIEGVKGGIKGVKGAIKTIKMGTEDYKKVASAIKKRKASRALKRAGKRAKTMGVAMEGGSEQRAVIPTEQMARMTAGIRA